VIGATSSQGFLVKIYFTYKTRNIPKYWHFQLAIIYEKFSFRVIHPQYGYFVRAIYTTYARVCEAGIIRLTCEVQGHLSLKTENTRTVQTSAKAYGGAA